MEFAILLFLFITLHGCFHIHTIRRLFANLHPSKVCIVNFRKKSCILWHAPPKAGSTVVVKWLELSTAQLSLHIHGVKIQKKTYERVAVINYLSASENLPWKPLTLNWKARLELRKFPSVLQCQRQQQCRWATIATVVHVTFVLSATTSDQSRAREQMFGPMRTRLSRHLRTVCLGPNFESMWSKSE